MAVIRLILLSLVLFKHCECDVNIATNNEAWYCNTNPLDLHPISPLSSNDLKRMTKLEQVHVMTRHGSRTSSENVQKYFPNMTQYYHCNISTITSRIQFNTNTEDEYFVSMLQIYQYDDQYLLHSNCQRMQSYPSLIQQHQQNAQILINAYMKNNSASQLFDIYAMNEESETQQFMKFYTSNKERCMLSTMVLVSTLLNITSSNQTSISPTIETITNDWEFNPYTSPNTLCTKNKQFNDWKAKYKQDITDNYITEKHNQFLLDKYNKPYNKYLVEGGNVTNTSVHGFDSAAFQATFFYCNGFDIPLKNDTFWEFVDVGYQYFVAIHPNKSSNNENERKYAQQKQCYHHFIAIPMYKRYWDDIQALINNDTNYKKFILHSAHDSSILYFLNGLGLHDGIMPYFAQMFTLEIYSADQNNQYNVENNIKYLFRWTNKGEFIPYEYCLDEYSINNQNGNGQQLCDLNILLENGFKNVNVTQREYGENLCKSVLDECVCGYCNDQENEKNDNKSEKWMLEEFSFIIGIIVGLSIFGLLMVINRYLNCIQKVKSRTLPSYQPTMDHSDVELNEPIPITLLDI